MSRRQKLAFLSIVLLALSMPGYANASSRQAGLAAYARENYVAAANILGPIAERGDAEAQFYIGFMYETGRGLPQSYVEAAIWYCRSAEQGNPTAQHRLGLLYDKGHGVPENKIEAHKWLNLAASHAPPRSRESWVRIRDAMAFKMSLAQLAVARSLATDWRPIPER